MTTDKGLLPVEPAYEHLPHLAGYIEQLGIPDTLEKAIRERDAWVESATQFAHNEEYYRGLLDQIAAHIGPDAFTADDGVVHDSPVRDKLPELVATRAPSKETEDALRGEIAELKRQRDHNAQAFAALVGKSNSPHPVPAPAEAIREEMLSDLDMARELIQEAKGHEGPNGGFVTDHLDFAEHWLDRVEAALRQPPPRSDDDGEEG